VSRWLPIALVLVAGCAPAPPEPPRSCVDPAPQAVVEATLGLEPAEVRGGHGEAATAGDAVAALRSPEVRRALAEEIGQSVDDPQGVTAEAEEDHSAVRVVVRAPHRAAAIAACHAWLRIAETHAVARDPAETWLAGEIERLEGAVAALDDDLAILPAMPPSSPMVRDEVLVAARVRRLDAQAHLRAAATSAEDPAAPPPVRAIARLQRTSRADRLEALTRGQGVAHPTVRALDDRIGFLEAQLAAQWASEEQAARSVEEAMLVLPPRADRAAVARALGARLRRVDPLRASSLDPGPLQILAVHAVLLGADDASLSSRYGATHPARVVLRVAIEALGADFTRRATPSPPASSRASARRSTTIAPTRCGIGPPSSRRRSPTSPSGARRPTRCASGRRPPATRGEVRGNWFAKHV
jgi:hypothetical protein